MSAYNTAQAIGDDASAVTRTAQRIIEDVYRTGVVRDREDSEHSLHSALSEIEGRFLFELVSSNPDIQRSLEVGCAYGLSSLFICSALAKQDAAEHVIIDPFQYSDWNGIGISHLERAGFDFIRLLVERSEFALPRLAERESGTFDLVFIDGMHTFDHTLVDLFYANRLLRVGGYIVVDDCTMPPVAKAVSYVSSYPAYRVTRQCKARSLITGVLRKTLTTIWPKSLSGSIPHGLYDNYYTRAMYSSMVALEKVSNDERHWNWFRSF